MDRETFPIFDNDLPGEIAERLRLVLVEMGILMKEIGEGTDCRVYELTRMTLLGEKEEEEEDYT